MRTGRSSAAHDGGVFPMIELLIASLPPEEAEPETRFGGRPLVAEDSQFAWPLCVDCGSETPMQFLGQLRLDPHSKTPTLLSLFMCAEDGCCTWEADGGANHAHIEQGKAFVLMDPPASEDATSLRDTRYGAQSESEDADDYDAARSNWGEAHGERYRAVLGQWGGTPEWQQADETPTCDCGKTMTFVAQLETGPDADHEMNFAGGCAYVFRCGDHAAKFLWQH
jgi:hypothetical protein